MRILLVAPEPFFEIRGTPLNVLQMCRALTDEGHEVHLATYPIGEHIDLPGLTIHRTVRIPGIQRVPIGYSKRKALLDVCLALSVYKLIRKGHFDVIHAVEESVFFCLPAARAKKLPLIYDLDSCISDQLEYAGVVSNRLLLQWVRRLERAALCRATCAITVCRSLTDFAKELCPDVAVFQIEDTPIPSSLREPSEVVTERLRQELKLVGRRVFVYTGNLESYQGIDLLLAAIPKVVSRHPDAAFLLVGGDPDQVATVRERATQMRVAEYVRLPGKCQPEELPEYMALADALLSPRIGGQNTPLKIYTYMYSERPIVATDLPTHTQVLDPSVAILVDPTADALADGIARVVAHPDRCLKLAEAARERVEREFSFEVFRRKLAA